MNFFKNIAFRDGYGYRYILTDLSKYLKKKHNSKIFAYGSEEVKYFYDEMVEKKIIDEFILCDHLHRVNIFEKIKNPKDVIKKSLINENFINASYNILRMTRRDLGLGFYPGARAFPNSPSSKKTNYLQNINAYNILISFWIDEFKKRKITLFLNGLKDEEFVCKAMNIKFRWIDSSRYGSYWAWFHGMRSELPEVKNSFKKLKRKKIKSVNIKSQYKADIETRKFLFSKPPFLTFLSKVFFEFQKSIYNFNNYKKYYFFSYVKYLFNQYRHKKLLTSDYVENINILNGKKFIYVPLHTEPESSLHWVSPECFNQMELILSLARDIPSDTYLVIKEHVYGVGARKKDYYEHIKSLKNTILIDVNISSLEVIKKSSAVAVVGGSAGVEASLMGIPVLVFAKYTFYDFLPHVCKISTNENNYELIRKLISKGVTQESMEAGSKLRQAIIESSFDMKKYHPFVNRQECSEESLLAMYKCLRKSFNKVFNL